MPRAQQSFIIDHADLIRARAAAKTGGQSLNAWMRAAIRQALDGPSAAATTQPSCYDLTIATRMDESMARMVDAVARIEAASALESETLALLNKAGNGFNNLLAKYQAAAPKA
jgi:hypothetical protein